MKKLTGTYAEEDQELEYICRVFVYNGKYYNGISEPIEVKDGDALVQYGQGTWFALYQKKN